MGSRSKTTSLSPGYHRLISGLCAAFQMIPGSTIPVTQSASAIEPSRTLASNNWLTTGCVLQSASSFPHSPPGKHSFGCLARIKERSAVVPPFCTPATAKLIFADSGHVAGARVPEGRLPVSRRDNAAFAASTALAATATADIAAIAAFAASSALAAAGLRCLAATAAFPALAALGDNANLCHAPPAPPLRREARLRDPTERPG